VATELQTPEGTEDTIEFDEIEQSIPIEKKGFKRGTQDPRWIIRRDWHNIGGKKVGQFRGGNNNRELTIQVQDDPLVNTLRAEPYEFDIAPISNEKQRFKDVVFAFSDIWNNTGIMADREEIDILGYKGDIPNVKGLGDKKTRLKFLDIAKKINLYVERHDKPPAAQKASKLELELEEFEEQPEISRWLRTTQFKDIGYTNDLKKALSILDMTPATILQGDSKDPKTQFGNPQFTMVDYIAWIAKKMEEKTWTADTGEKFSLKEWAFAPKGRPFISGAGNKHTQEGETIAERKKSTAMKASESQWTKFKTAIKHYTGTHGRLPTGKIPQTIFGLPSPILKYAVLKMTATEIEAAKNCLADPKEEDLKFTQESVSVQEMGGYEKGKYVKHPREGLARIDEYDTSYEDWYDAYMYFMIALDVGWRANEGLTATVGKPDEDPFSTGIWINNKSELLPEGVMNIKFLTRKTWHLTPPRYSHTEFILNPITRKMIEEKQRKVKEGIAQFGKMNDEEIFKIYGIKRWKHVGVWNKKQNKFVQTEVPNEDHALIGYDGKYVTVESMRFPSKHKLTKKEKREQEQAGKTIEYLQTTDKPTRNLHGIMRQCIVKSGVNLEATVVNEKTGETVQIGQYFLRDTMHSLRHVFAQAWLLKSNWNFSFVAKKGHWGASKILEDAYGGVDEKEFFIQSITFARVSMLEVEQKQKISMEEKLKNTIKGQDFTDEPEKQKGVKTI